jgi:hypothetical protein
MCVRLVRVTMIVLLSLLVLSAAPHSSHATLITSVNTTTAPTIDFVGSIGGHIGGVAIDGAHAYFAEGGGLSVLDISNALAPTRIARLPLPAIAEGVHASGNHVYIAASDGVYIADVSNPAAPKLVGSYATPGQAQVVRVVSTRAYVTVKGVYSSTSGDYVGKGLLIVNVSDPALPTLLGRYETSDFPDDVQVVGNLAYLTHYDGFVGGVQILNISDPANIVPLGNYTTPGKDNAAIDVVNGTAYIAYSDESARNGGLQIVNVSNPANPTLLGSYQTPTFVLGVRVVGSVAYLAAYTRLVLLNISTPATPTLISQYQLSGGAEALSDALQVAGGFAYLPTESYAHEQAAGVQIVDVSTPANPTPRGIYRTLWAVGQAGCRDSIRLAGSLGYAQTTGAIVRSFDATTPTTPTLVSTTAPTRSYDLAIVGSLLYNAVGKGGLQIFDISNPITPTLRGSYTAADLTDSPVNVTDNRAYVVGDFKLMILDVSNPNNPTFLGQYSPISGPHSIKVVDTLAYIASDVGLHIIDVSNPSNPIQRGLFFSAGAANAVQVVGQRAYVAARGTYNSQQGLTGNGLEIVDVSDPTSPKLLGGYATPDAAEALQVVGNRAYVVDFKGVYVIDVSDPANPTLLTTYHTPGSPIGIEISGDLIYIADGGGGLQILRVRDSSSGSGLVTPNGGTLNFAGALSLQFPPNAVNSPITVTYTRLVLPTQSLGSARSAGHSFTLEARDGSGLPITHFVQPYTMVISYTDEELAALEVSEDDLNVAFWNGSAWVDTLPCAGCGVDAVSNRITVVLDHFTEFALVGGEETRVFLPLVRR